MRRAEWGRSRIGGLPPELKHCFLYWCRDPPFVEQLNVPRLHCAQSSFSCTAVNTVDVKIGAGQKVELVTVLE